MAATNIAILSERLYERPEPLREELAGYIAEHLDEIEQDMNWLELSDEIKQELLAREAAAIANPREGSSWEEVKERILNSVSK